MVEVYYRISDSGKHALRSTIKGLSPARMNLGEFQEDCPIYPVEVAILEDLLESDHGMDMREIKDRWGSRGLFNFKRLQKAGYIIGDTE